MVNKMANKTTTEKKEEKKVTYSIYNILRNRKLHSVWTQMVARCFSPHHRHYKNYGARGINVCSEWSQSWDSFAKWAIVDQGYKPGAGLTLDRIDNDKDYGPDNCRFVSMQENCWNKRTSVMVEVNGVTKCIAAWAEDLGLKYHCLYARHKRGTWPLPHETTF